MPRRSAAGADLVRTLELKDKPFSWKEPMLYWKELVPPDFQVPDRREGLGFHLRMLTVNDLVKDYDAVMSSVARLKGLMRPAPNGQRA